MREEIPLLDPEKKKKQKSNQKKTETDPTSESSKQQPNSLPLSDQLQKVVDRMKVDEKTGSNVGFSLSARLQDIFSHMRAKEAHSRKDSNPRRVQLAHRDPEASKLPSQSEIEAQFQTALNLLSTSQLQIALDQFTGQETAREGNPREPSGVLPRTEETPDLIEPVITSGEYVESEDEKIGHDTSSDTTEELNFEDMLGDVAELPLEPLPGHEVLAQLPVDQEALSQESSDDDYTDWPTIRPLRIDMGIPVRVEDYRPRGRGRPRKVRPPEGVQTGAKVADPSRTRSAGRGKTRSRSASRRD